MEINPHISFVSPVYKAAGIIQTLVFELVKVANDLQVSYEIILVDDRSPDNCWIEMKELSTVNTCVKSIRLSRNFGQHAAIMAGLSQAKGTWIVVLDCDMQDQPKEILKLYAKVIEGYDIVKARRTERQDSFLKKMSSKVFATVYKYLTDTQFDHSIANFGIYHRLVIKEVLEMKDYIKSFPLFINWVGFNATAIEVNHAPRLHGSTSYSYRKLLSLAFNTIISFSNKPLKLMVKFGMMISLFSVLFGFYTFLRFLNGDITVLGYSSLIISIWLLSGVLISIVGIVGLYIGKVFDQVKMRKPYIIDKTIDHGI